MHQKYVCLVMGAKKTSQMGELRLTYNFVSFVSFNLWCRIDCTTTSKITKNTHQQNHVKFFPPHFIHYLV